MNVHSFLLIVVAAIMTYCTRALPFLIFNGKREVPEYVRYLGSVLPRAVIAILVVFCLKSTNVLAFPFGLPEIISVLIVAILHIYKRNNMLSISVGTIVYMALVQFVF